MTSSKRSSCSLACSMRRQIGLEYLTRLPVAHGKGEEEGMASATCTRFILATRDGRGNRRTNQQAKLASVRTQKPGRGHLCPSLSLFEQLSIALLNPQPPSFCPSASPTFAGLKDHLLLPSARAGSQITRHYRLLVDRSIVSGISKMPASSSREGTEVGMQFATVSN